MTQIQNKRRFPRYDVRESLQYRITDRQMIQERNLHATSGTLSCDLSMGGVRFWSNDFVPVRAPLELQISLGQDGLLTINGEVAWVVKIPHGEYYYVGVAFADEAPGFPQERLSKSLRRFSPELAA